jgi:hypothetical protein
VDEEAKCAHQDVRHMVEEGHVQDHCSVPTGERASVPNKTHQKYDFVTKLEGWKREIFNAWNSHA